MPDCQEKKQYGQYGMRVRHTQSDRRRVVDDAQGVLMQHDSAYDAQDGYQKAQVTGGEPYKGPKGAAAVDRGPKAEYQAAEDACRAYRVSWRPIAVGRYPGHRQTNQSRPKYAP
jgi:hypothetical protein